MRRPLTLIGACLLLIGGGVASQPAAVRACSIDGIPSISANGHLAARNLVLPTSKTLPTWTPFVFHQTLARNQAIRLSEDTAKVARVLTAAELHGRWRWSFGDGQTGIAQAAITHRYARAGQYHVTVSTYDPLYNGWNVFDSVSLTIRS